MLSGTSCALVPSGKAVWLRIEEWNMHWPKLHFFSGFLSTMLLTFLSFSLFLMQQTPRAIVVKCDGSVYDVDVDVDFVKGVLTIFFSSFLSHHQRISQGGVRTSLEKTNGP